jgi:hypothetical protein
MAAARHATGPVFCNTTGGHIRISDLHKESSKPILKKAALPDIRVSDLRHTSATLRLRADEPEGDGRIMVGPRKVVRQMIDVTTSG